MSLMPSLHITGDEAADKLLSEDPFALLLGMALDQQYRMEDAFKGGHKLVTRLGHLDPAKIAEMDPEEFKTIASTPPAIHRFPGSMSAKVQGIATIVTNEYGGDVTRLWTEATSGKDLLKRIQALPGFGKQKAQIFVSLLAKQLGVRPEGWQEAVGDYALDGYRSVADVVDVASLQKVRDYKQQKKAAAKAAG
ncbi:MAG TPA: HhH-GPD-type base excision DNA repair protein [Nocardioides sp.]